MNIAARSLDRILILSLAAIFILIQITHWAPFTVLLGIMVFVTIALLLPQLIGTTRILTIGFLVGGVLLMVLHQANVKVWLEAATMNVTVATLFVFAPLFGIPVRSPQYVAALKQFYETKLTSRTGFFLGSQLLTQLMGVFINVGCIPVVYHLAAANTRFKSNRMLADALNRGFGGAIFWSPYFSAMALVSTALHLSWTALLPYMLGLSLLSVLVSLLVELPLLRAKSRGAAALSQDEAAAGAEEAQAEPAEPIRLGRALFPLGLYLAAAIAVVIILEQVLELPIVLITCMAAVLFPLLWCLGTRAMATYRQGLKDHVTKTIPSLKKEITLFLAAGFFSGAMAGTSFGDWIPALLQMVPLPIPLVLSVLTVFLITLTSLIGLHPIILVSILATGIEPAAVGVSPVFLAILLLGGWGISNTISPASAVNNLLSGLIKKDVLKLASSNYRFVIVMAVVIPVYVLVFKP
ncbi:hypothetical protein [Paenibacillus sp. y28]|uniref:hypothetical protein n=1 Tax=Paenibacillus sp. y28 TaxID=3129110 RepID=UPI003018AF94